MLVIRTKASAQPHFPNATEARGFYDQDKKGGTLQNLLELNFLAVIGRSPKQLKLDFEI